MVVLLLHESLSNINVAISIPLIYMYLNNNKQPLYFGGERGVSEPSEFFNSIPSTCIDMGPMTDINLWSEYHTKYPRPLNCVHGWKFAKSSININ